MKRGAVCIILLAVSLLAGCEQKKGRQEAEEEIAVSEANGENAGEEEPEESYWYPRGEAIVAQSFELYMEPIGDVYFGSYMPGEEAGKHGDAVFLVKKMGVVWQQLEGVTEDNIREGMTLLGVEAVSFSDVNMDGYDDILLICCYQTEPGSEKYEVRYYQGSDTGSFTLERELSEAAAGELEKPTIPDLRIYLRKEMGIVKEEVEEGEIAEEIVTEP